MNARIGLLVALLGASAYDASATNIGKYKLNMTNTEAAKIGLEDCKELGLQIICTGKFNNPQINGHLSFDPRSKRLKKIGVSARYGGMEGSKLEQDLELAHCPPRLNESFAGRSTCHFSDGLRVMDYKMPAQDRFSGPFWRVDAYHKPGADMIFLKKINAEEKKASSLINFQAGK